MCTVRNYEWLYSCVAYGCRRSAWCTSNLLQITLVTCWHRFPAVSTKRRFQGFINFEPRTFSSIPTLILFPASSAFCWYLTLAFKAFVALARAVTDTQDIIHGGTLFTLTTVTYGWRSFRLYRLEYMSSVTATCLQIQVRRTENHSWQGAYLPNIVFVYAGQFHSFQGRQKHFRYWRHCNYLYAGLENGLVWWNGLQNLHF